MAASHMPENSRNQGKWDSFGAWAGIAAVVAEGPQWVESRPPSRDGNTGRTNLGGLSLNSRGVNPCSPTGQIIAVDKGANHVANLATSSRAYVDIK